MCVQRKYDTSKWIFSVGDAMYAAVSLVERKKSFIRKYIIVYNFKKKKKKIQI